MFDAGRTNPECVLVTEGEFVSEFFGPGTMETLPRAGRLRSSLVLPPQVVN